MTDTTKMVCRVCHRPLNYAVRYHNDGDMEECWEHGSPAPDFPPHDPEPVPAWENPTWLVCDFCCVQPPMWVLGCRDFVTLLPRTVLHSNSLYEDAWSCCDRCYDLLEAGQMERLAQLSTDFILAKQAWPREEKRRRRPHLLREVRQMHGKFVSHRTYLDHREEVIPVRADPDGRTGPEALDITQSR